MQDNENFILRAYLFDGKGGARHIADDEVPQALALQDLSWVHLDARSPESRGWMAQNAPDLDPTVIEALLAEESRPRITEFEEGALVILRGVNLHENARTEDMISIRLWVDSTRIISTRLRQLKAVQDICARLESGKGPRDPADFFISLSTRLFERMEPVISELDEKTDDIEESLLDEMDASRRRDVNNIRKKAIILRRYIAPQKDVMSAMRHSDLQWLQTSHKRRLNENYERIQRYIEELDAIRERAQIVKDELATIISDKMNRNMYVLSTIAAIFLPLGFLTGLLGINVGGMPGADYEMAFWVVTAICAGFAVLTGLVFKFAKWL